MTAHRWRNSAGHLIRVDGHHVLCETCPCEGCPEGSALYKIKYAEQDTSCTGGAANEYRLNISCECKCLITGAIPDPIPEGKTAADYYASYPLTGGTGGEGDPYWKRTVAGGPFVDIEGGLTAAEQCDALQVDGCVSGCSWYKIRKAYYDVDCQSANSGYNLDSDGNPGADCECRCLIYGAVPDPIPEGKTAADYTGYYQTVTGEYKYTLFGPYSATCDLSADQVCATAKIEGYDYAWGCSWDTMNNQPRMWYHTSVIWYTDACSTFYDQYPAHECVSDYELNHWKHPIGECYPGADGKHYLKKVVIIGPEFRECDV